jgi:pilus assembly protein Flp/PilA
MKKFLLPVLMKMQDLIAREEGQDLVEYALVAALIAFAAVAGIQTLASDINAAFTSFGSQLTSAT